MTNFFQWPLTHPEVITRHQKRELCRYLMKSSKLTQGDAVKDFESRWSEWQGCKYSVFVNSGSSANFIAHHAAKSLYTTRFAHGICTQACTWSTTISPALLSNDTVALLDINLTDFSPNLNQLEYLFKKKKVRVLFLAHLLGFNALSEDLLALIDKYKIILLEDCCESHGATYKNRKIGNFGLGSTFSFYIGHHMTTIEGGMVCTDDKRFYEQCLLIRSHGLLRELPITAQKKYTKTHRDFTFIRPGLNFRNTDFNAKLGLLQLENLDEAIKIRKRNFAKFKKTLPKNSYYSNFKVEGNSNFCFPIISTSNKIKSLSSILYRHGVESRPIIGGNLAAHPMLANFKNPVPLLRAGYVHRNGLYVGNNSMVDLDDISKLSGLLNECSAFEPKTKVKTLV